MSRRKRHLPERQSRSQASVICQTNPHHHKNTQKHKNTTTRSQTMRVVQAAQMFQTRCKTLLAQKLRLVSPSLSQTWIHLASRCLCCLGGSFCVVLVRFFLCLCIYIPRFCKILHCLFNTMCRVGCSAKMFLCSMS